MRILLDGGACIEVREGDVNKNTSLLRGAMRGHEEIVRILLNAGANLDVTNASGETPLSIATKKGHVKVVDILKEKIEATAKKFNTWLKV